MAQQRQAHREWIGGRAITLLGHYFRPDDPTELTQALGADWAEVLAGLPQEYIQQACIKYMKDQPKIKPTPGAIFQIASSLMPRPQVVKPEDPGNEKRKRVTQQEADAILEEIGFAVKKINQGDSK